MSDVLIIDREEALRTTHVEIGQNLDNGTLLLAETVIDRDRWGVYSIVLCMKTGPCEFHRFVTWRRVRGATSQLGRTQDCCVSGHYFSNLGVAWADYERRSNEG